MTVQVRPISSSNNLVRVDYSAALFSLNSTLWHRSESCILTSLGYITILTGLTFKLNFPE
ncbi:hypothetical protein [Vibrio caribbeanicus]|uniref:hypothetical protein n=1 Tax=Vibrio caribbeanicus TaxID=701175 RepID=UPI0009D77459